MQIIVPEFSDGIKINWNRAFPINRSTVGVHITKDLVLAFEDIFCPKTETKFVIGNALEDSEHFDCKDFDKKLKEYQRFGQFKAARFFKGERSSIFFDPDEAELLKSLFNAVKFTGIVSVYNEGKRIDIMDLTPKGIQIVKKELMDQGAIFPLPIDQYLVYRNVKKVKIIGQGGGKSKMKKVWYVLGAVCVNAVGAFLLYKGLNVDVEVAQVVKDSIKDNIIDDVVGTIVEE